MGTNAFNPADELHTHTHDADGHTLQAVGAADGGLSLAGGV